MTRYNESADERAFVPLYDQFEGDGYREGVNRVLEYVESINAYPKLIAELRWAIQEGII
jgi:hypothetical protein